MPLPVYERGPVSIPTRFEVIRNHGDDVVEGFGSRTTRFRNSCESKPGPGHYSSKVSPLQDPVSLSKKGYSSGFVSKAQRFSNSRAHEMSSLPGPGHYNPAVTVLKAGQKRSRAQRPSSTPLRFNKLANQQKAGADTQNRKFTPGPGYYDTYKDTWLDSTRTFASSFRSRAPRQPNNKAAASTPAPGSYFRPMNYIQGSPTQESAAFRSRTDRQGTMYTSSRTGNPGPGDYNPTLASSKLDFHRPANAKSSHPGVLLRRSKRSKAPVVEVTKEYVGKQDEPQKQADQEEKPSSRAARASTVPGPGSYATNRSTLNFQTGGAVSAFRSKTKRNAVNREKRSVPGPAFYKSNPLVCKERRSFLLNTSDKWL